MANVSLISYSGFTKYNYNYGESGVGYNKILKFPNGNYLMVAIGGKYLNIINSTGGTIYHKLISGGADERFWSVKIQSDNKILIGGDFTNYNGYPYFIRLNSNGTTDTTFMNALNGGTGLLGQVVTMEYNPNSYNGATIWMMLNGGGGSNTPYKQGITILNMNAGLVTSKGLDTENIYAQPDGKILLVSGSGVLEKYNNSGTFAKDNTYTPIINSPYFRVGAVDSNNCAYIIGHFTTVNGSPSRYICKLSSTGAIDISFNVGAGFLNHNFYDNNNKLESFQIQPDGKILMSQVNPITLTSGYNEYNSTSVFSIWRLNTNGTLDTNYHMPLRAIDGYGYDTNPANSYNYPSIFSLVADSNTKITTIGQFWYSGYDYQTNQWNEIEIDTTSYSGTYNPVPLNLTGIYSGTTAPLTWTKPHDDLGVIVIKKKEVGVINYTVLTQVGKAITGYTLTGLIVGHKYDVRVAGVASEYPQDIQVGFLAPSNLVVDSTTNTTATLSWNVNEILDSQALYMQIGGGVWTLYSTLGASVSGITVTGLTVGLLQYSFYVVGYYGIYNANTNTVTIGAMPTVTTNTISSISYSGATCGGNVVYSGTTAVTARGVCWNTIGNPTTANSKTSNGSGIGNFVSSITGLVKGTKYYVRAYATNTAGTAYGNERIFTTYDIPIVDTSIPYGIDIFTAILGGNVISGSGYTVTERGIYYGTTPTPTTKLQIGSGLGLFSASPVLLESTVYYVMAYAVNAAGTGYGEILTFQTLKNIYPPPFCDGTNYEITEPSTCGNTDGILWIEDLRYFKYYDFTLLDAFGNSYAPNLITGEFTGLQAGWYFLAVTPYPQYQYIYGTETCYIPWIAVIDIDTPMTLDSVSIRKAQCQPFDRQAGRIYYKIGGFDTGHTYSFYAWTTAAQPYIAPPTYYQKLNITSNNDVLIPVAAPDCYYALLVDETTGCHLVLDAECVGEETPFSLGGIKKLWIAPWSSDIEYNYWDSKDDDYFLEFADVSFFTSTKITEFYKNAGTIQWYSLPIAPQVVKLSQKLNKVRQGFIFEDSMDCAISAADAFKWQEIQPIVNPENKWIIVCIDDNDFAWVSGYRHGARVTAFKNQSGERGGENGYTLSFTSQSENKILTAIDKAYITNHII